MARIRTVKPEFFRHEKLDQLERESGLPIKISFIGLFCVADREGRFEWKPNILKLDILPFSEIDFSRVLNALWSRGFLDKYTRIEDVENELNGSGNKSYGFIESFSKHQVINNKESASKLPNPCDDCFIFDRPEIIFTRESRDDNAMATPLSNYQGEREEEKEGKGKGRGKGNLTNASALVEIKKSISEGSKIWDSYSQAYQARYQVAPIRNAKTNSQCSQLSKRLGQDAIDVVKFYLTHNDGWYLKRQHDLGSLLQAAESLHTQWQRGSAVTGAQVRQFEKQSTNMDLMAKIERGEV